MGVLYALSIPWYRQGGAETGTLFGFPSWVTIAILCYFGAALANAGAWLCTDVPDAPGEDAPERAP